MKVERFDNDNERGILTALINDPLVLGAVSARWEFPGLFSSPWCNDVGWWCVSYYKKYGKAPKREIEGLFRSWAQSNQDQDRIKTMDRFLRSLDFELPSSNALYTIDQAGKYFNRVKRQKLMELVKAEDSLGHDDLAESLLTKHTRIELGTGTGIDLIQDKENLNQAFAQINNKSLIRYPKALGNFFRDYLYRGSFYSFMAPTKTGKTTWLVDMAYRAMSQERRVAFFSIGDESKEQTTKRFAVRMCQHPLISTNKDESWPCTVEIPSFLSVSCNGKGSTEITPTLETFSAPLSLKQVQKTWKQIDHEFNEKSFIRISVHPNFNVSTLGIKSILDGWAKEGWIADVVILDYADNLAPVDTREKETRDRINTTWKMLRGLSMELNVLLVTATQVKTEGFKTKWLTKSHFADDKRKIENVDGMIGINQNPEEKKNGIFRLNWAALRGGDFHEEQGVYCAACLALANPCVKSTF